MASQNEEKKPDDAQEPLKDVLIDSEGNQLHGEEVKVFDTLSIIQHSGGDGTCFYF